MTETCWVRTPEELRRRIQAISASRAIALDTESDSLHHYAEKVCLVQLADGAAPVSLLDPLALGDLSHLRELMADPGVEKVFHGAEYDIALLKRDFGFSFASLFDTQIAARFLGRKEFGLQALLQREFGVHLSKASQKADWSRRPLTASQEAYAAEDVRHLIPLRDRLLLEIRMAGREAWVREECDALALTPAAVYREPADFLRVKGARDLHLRDLAVLRELFALREAWARKLDRPLFRVLGDEALVLLSQRRPARPESLRALPGFHSPVWRDRGPELLEAIRRGESVPHDQCPRYLHGRRRRPPLEAVLRAERLRSRRSATAERVGLDPGLLLPQRLIDRIALDHPRTVEELSRVPEIRTWRVEEFGREILAALQNVAPPLPR